MTLTEYFTTIGAGHVWYDENKEIISAFLKVSGIHELTPPENAKYIRLTQNKNKETHLILTMEYYSAQTNLGEVWIQTDIDKAPVSFNAIKKNKLMIYPYNKINQWNGSKWSSKDSYLYQNGTPICKFHAAKILLCEGENNLGQPSYNCTDGTGSISSKSITTLSDGSIELTINMSTAGWANVWVAFPVKVTRDDYTNLHFSVTSTAFSGSAQGALDITSAINTGGGSTITRTQYWRYSDNSMNTLNEKKEFNIDISNLNEFYIRFWFQLQSSTTTTIVIDSLKLT